MTVRFRIFEAELFVLLDSLCWNFSHCEFGLSSTIEEGNNNAVLGRDDVIVVSIESFQTNGLGYVKATGPMYQRKKIYVGGLVTWSTTQDCLQVIENRKQGHLETFSKGFNSLGPRNPLFKYRVERD
jgi:hypothetical protein